MRDLEKQERFELEVLDRMNSGRFLNRLVLGGGTMLRLCYGLDRFSVDIEFWVIKEIDMKRLFEDLLGYLAQHYELKDSANKFYTLLFEIKSGNFPRSLKIEIRKETRKIKTEQMIAYSPYSNVQVLVKAVSLQDMMKAKIAAFLDRNEIRDVFDMEFLLRKGISPDVSPDDAGRILKRIDSLTKKDYTVKLGSLLEAKLRRYYVSENFKVLKAVLQELRGKR